MTYINNENMSTDSCSKQYLYPKQIINNYGNYKYMIVVL